MVSLSCSSGNSLVGRAPAFSPATDPILTFAKGHWRQMVANLNPPGVIAMQWTKPGVCATLQCNVDRGSACRLVFSIPHRSPAQPARTPMDLHLRGKRVLITGASKGIG